jgi:hypothetical protein
VGREFQEAVTHAIGEVENVAKFPVRLRTGVIYRTIPDIISVTSNSIIEIKRVTRIGYYSPQLQAQVRAAHHYQMNYRLILAPGATANDLSPALKAVMLLYGFEAQVFDAATGKLTTIFP